MMKRLRSLFRRRERKALRPRLSLTDFRLRLLSLVVLAFLPLFILTIVTAAEQRGAAVKAKQDEARRLVRLFVADQAQAVDGARQILVALTQLPEVRGRDPNVCNALLGSLLRQYSRYVNIGVAEASGDVFCSAVPTQAPANVRDTLWFNGVLTTNNFYGGEYNIGLAQGRAAIPFGYPIRDAQGQVMRVVYATLDLTWLNRIVEQAHLPEEGSFLVIDHTGTVLVRYPNAEQWFGKNFPDSPIVRMILTRRGEGVTEAEDIDGVMRLHAFMRLSDAPGAENFYADVGVARDLAFADANRALGRTLAGLGAVTAAALIAAWFGGNVLVVREIRALKEVDRLKSEFVSLASHQLRTPLTSLKWDIELLLTEQAGPLTDDQRAFLKESEDASRHLIDLVRELLNISRIEAGRMRVRPEPTDVGVLANSVVKEIEPQMKEKSIAFIFEHDRTLPQVNLDPLLIRQVIMNFLSNAVKYTLKGGSINFRIYREGKDVRFSVTDTGLGIPRDEQRHVFERFYRASNVQMRASEGTGLGLYLAKSLVELSGGRIGFVSQEGKGSTFWFTIPLTGSPARQGETTLNS